MTNIYCQKEEKFKTGVRLIEKKSVGNIKEYESILFVLEINGCESDFYIDLKKKIEKRFKKTNKNISFNFKINTIIETEQIPKDKHLYEDYDLICEIKIENFKSWDQDLVKKRKQNYDLVLIVKNNNSNSVLSSVKINVNSYWTITTQNKNSSKLIYKLFNY